MKAITKSAFSIVTSFLLVLAPMLVSTQACILLWGEPDCPKSLR